MFTIFHLKRLDKIRYNEAASFVVIATSRHEARRMAGDLAGDEGQYAWVDPGATSCVSIGLANEHEEIRVVCRDFCAG